MINEKKKILIYLGISILVLFVFFISKVKADFPEKPITIIVNMEAGGPTDISVRAMAPTISSVVGQPVIVENKGGGGGTLALAIIATAKPDGYNLCAAQNVSIVDSPLMQKVPFKPLKSFTPIVGFALATHTALLVKKDAPWKTFKEFIDYAKANPGKIKYSSAGVGTGMHVIMEYIAKKEGIKWVHVPYKGAAPSRTALLGGHVDACSSGLGWAPFVESGQLRVLVTHGEKRCPQTPDIPTLKELGYDIANLTIHSIFGPAGIPNEIVKKLEIAFKKGVESPGFKEVAERLYLTPYYLDSKEYENHLKEKWIKTEKIFKEIGIITEPATPPY
jgi:tripartite-type tricarboxylate transporter receptor subunit TctC